MPDHVAENPKPAPTVPEPMPETADAVTAERQALESRIFSLLEQGRRGSNWFYWVAGLSLVNSVIALSGGAVHFVVGLGVTLLVDAIATGVAQQAPEIGTVVLVVAFAMNVLVAAVVVGFGWLAGKRYLAVFAIGMVLYLLDGLLYVLFQQWMSVAFHAFALVCMWGGFQAYRQLRALEDELVNQPSGPPTPQAGSA